MLGEPSHLGSDLVLRIGEELERRHLSSLQVRPLRALKRKNSEALVSWS
jgi:hypothetical protein